CVFFFFFQAEDGIRDWSVTGVQTCALPISISNGCLPERAWLCHHGGSAGPGVVPRERPSPVETVVRPARDVRPELRVSIRTQPVDGCAPPPQGALPGASL